MEKSRRRSSCVRARVVQSRACVCVCVSSSFHGFPAFPCFACLVCLPLFKATLYAFPLFLDRRLNSIADVYGETRRNSVWVCSAARVDRDREIYRREVAQLGANAQRTLRVWNIAFCFSRSSPTPPLFEKSIRILLVRK